MPLLPVPVSPDRSPLLTPLGFILRRMPDAVHTHLLSQLINHLLRGQPLAAELGPLEGKRLRLSVADSGNEITFLIRRGALCPLAGRRGEDWDVRIRGRLEDFWRLAFGVEDPDTLFFHRHLDLEGETEAGLYLKNLLDGMDFDWEAHVRAVMGESPGRRVAAAIRRTGLDRAARRLIHPPDSTPDPVARRGPLRD